MRPKIRPLLALVIVILALSSCNPTASPTPTGSAAPTQTATLAPTPVTATPATETAAPPLAGLDMLDATHGWAWTSSNQLLSTSDGGQTWTDRTPAGQINLQGFFALNGQSAWVPVYLPDSARFGLLHTTDGESSWIQYPYGPSNGLHFTDSQSGWAEETSAGAGNLYVTFSQTTDGGATWTPVALAPPQSEPGLPAATLHLCNLCNDSFYFDPQRLLIVHGDMGSMQPSGSVRLEVSFDLGKTWRSENLPVPADQANELVAPEKPLFFDGGNGLLPVELVQMSSGGSVTQRSLALYRTQDGGASWTQLPVLPEGAAAGVQARILPLKSIQDLFALCAGGLCASHDAGQSWQTIHSNLDFTQSDQRSFPSIDFIDTHTGWALLMQGENSTLYKTDDGGVTWTALHPLLAASPSPKVVVDTSVPTPTPVPSPTPEPSATPNVSFDPSAQAYRIRFAPGGTWVEIHDTISADAPKRYVLAALRGQVLGVSIEQGAGFSVSVGGADGKLLSDAANASPFWRGTLPSTQDYLLTVSSQTGGPLTLRVTANPPGQATQGFSFTDGKYLVSLYYNDAFAPTVADIPIEHKGNVLLALAFIDTPFYFSTNLSEAYLLLTGTPDAATVATCTKPLVDRGETLQGQVSINGYTFTEASFTEGAAGNRYEQIAYRTVAQDKCFEVIYLIHSTAIGNYPAGTVKEFDRTDLLARFEAVLNSFIAK